VVEAGVEVGQIQGRNASMMMLAGAAITRRVRWQVAAATRSHCVTATVDWWRVMYSIQCTVVSPS
jgi:hypothetical protein